MAEGLHRVLGNGWRPPAADWLFLALWAVAAPLVAARTFSFD